MSIGWPADLTLYKFLTDWGSFIGGSFALIAGAVLYIIGRAQVTAITKQTEELKRGDRRRLAHDRLVAARILDASLQVIEEDLAAASDSYHSPRDNEIIAAGDANPIRQRINKPGFPLLWEKIGILDREVAVMFLVIAAEARNS